MYVYFSNCHRSFRKMKEKNVNEKNISLLILTSRGASEKIFHWVIFIYII